MTHTQLHDRALEPISELMMARLTVPYIHHQVRWPGPRGSRVDVLAIDRAGRGDPHVVEAKVRFKSWAQAVEEVQEIPAAYKWLAYYADTAPKLHGRMPRILRGLFPKSGAGRVGLIEIVRNSEDELSAEIVVRAERFPGVYHKEVDAFSEEHEPVFRI